MTCNAADRIDLIKQSSDIVWLEKVKSPRVTGQITVRHAAKRRIKALRKSESSAKSAVKKSPRFKALIESHHNRLHRKAVLL